MQDSRVLEAGSDYYSVDETIYWWKGAGVIQGIDDGNARVFTFVTHGSGGSFEESVLRANLDGSFFHSWVIAESGRLVDKESLIDFFAEKILMTINEKDEVSIPVLVTNELMTAGIIDDGEGQQLLPL